MAALGAIWTQSLDGIIGDGHGMPWHLPEDLKHFKETTLGRPIVMGRRTWESLPVRPLPSRPNHIVSSRQPGEWSDGAYVSKDLPDLQTDAWIIGGSQLYEATLDEVSVIELTLIDAVVAEALGKDAVYAPRISKDDFELTDESEWLASEKGRVLVRDDRLGAHGEDEPSRPLLYKFLRFERKA